jgi:hypothetical protein
MLTIPLSRAPARAGTVMPPAAAADDRALPPIHVVAESMAVTVAADFNPSELDAITQRHQARPIAFQAIYTADTKRRLAEACTTGV